MKQMSFSEQIKSPHWQRKRLEVLDAARWTCEGCDAKDLTLHVHHKRYIKGRMYWEYERSQLMCLCEDCHAEHHQAADSLNLLLSDIDLKAAFALVAGFHHNSDWVDRENARQAGTDDALTYAAGFTAWIVSTLPTIEHMHAVAEFATNLTREDSESRMALKHESHLFGRG